VVSINQLQKKLARVHYHRCPQRRCVGREWKHYKKDCGLPEETTCSSCRKWYAKQAERRKREKEGS